MEEILPGVVHWRTRHPNIRSEVDSWWLSDAGVLIDPLVPAQGGGLEWFAGQPTQPAAIVLSNRHHYRGSEAFRERFGCAVHVPRAGLHEFGADRQPVAAYDPGDELPGGLIVHEIDALCPDDMALHLPGAQAVFFADGVVGARGDAEGALGFVPDALMDDVVQPVRRVSHVRSRPAAADAAPASSSTAAASQSRGTNVHAIGTAQPWSRSSPSMS